MRAMEVELDMYKQQVDLFKSDIQEANGAMRILRQRWVAEQRRARSRQSGSEYDTTVNSKANTANNFGNNNINSSYSSSTNNVKNTTYDTGNGNNKKIPIAIDSPSLYANANTPSVPFLKADGEGAKVLGADEDLLGGDQQGTTTVAASGAGGV